MTSIVNENLDERIERIMKRNEEIEKKYREAEEDRLMALKENAMVKTKPPNDEDWPKTHKFDELDFTYDVNPKKIEEHSKATSPIQLEEEHKKREYKKFADGEGPPPDPSYNFLADAQRDGKLNSKLFDNKDNRQGNIISRSNKDPIHRRGNVQISSFRGRNSEKCNQMNVKVPKQNSQLDYEQWRSERKRIDDARIQRQIVGDKWKREWDHEKLSNSVNSSLLNMENTQEEHKGNITVSVSQAGEVKSVKLTTVPTIGTGRVGPRQVNKPKFQIQTFEKSKKVIGNYPICDQKLQTDPNNFNNNKKSTRNSGSVLIRDSQSKCAIEEVGTTFNVVTLMVPDQTVHTSYLNQESKQIRKETKSQVLGNISELKDDTLVLLKQNGNAPKDLSRKLEFTKKSVQDRLLRIRSQQKPHSENVASTFPSIDMNADADIESTSIQHKNQIAACY